jgi:hypothetical protein
VVVLVSHGHVQAPHGSHAAMSVVHCSMKDYFMVNNKKKEENHEEHDTPFHQAYQRRSVARPGISLS